MNKYTSQVSLQKGRLLVILGGNNFTYAMKIGSTDIRNRTPKRDLCNALKKMVILLICLGL